VLGWVAVLGLLLGIAAIVLGIMALKKPATKGFGIAGLILGVLGALTSIVMTIIWIAAIAWWGTAANVVGNAADQAQKALQDQDKQAQQVINAKKDFAKGETAVFNTLEVKVNSVKRDYQPSEDFMQAADGKEYVVLNLTIKNTDKSSQDVSLSSFEVNDNGVLEGSAFLDEPAPTLESSTLAAGGEMTGNVVYEVGKGDSGLKLVYTTYVYSFTDSSKSGEQTYTLAF
jgi:hypothetical protein